MGAERIDVFVPGHVTGFFSIHRRDDPMRSGSRGAGLTLTDGIHVSVESASSTSVTLDGSMVDVDAVNRVVDAFDRSATISITSDVPIGAGFGASGAMALGTAIGLAEITDEPQTENELTAIAHAADVTAGTGLGDVVAQMRGGAPVRIEPGGPGYGTLDGLPTQGRVEYLTLGDLSTEKVLAGGHEQINAAGEAALGRLLDHPTLQKFVTESRRFAEESGLITEDIQGVLTDVEDIGGTASMAMLGRTVFALGTGLSDAGYDPAICAIDHAGARRESDVRAYYPRDDHLRV